jgi:hypothetical protein
MAWRGVVAAVAAVFLAGSASAATLSIAGPGDGSAKVLPTSFNLDDSSNGAVGWSLAGYQALVPAGHGYDGDTVLAIQGDKKSAANGLSLDSKAKVTFTYLGFEAGFTNSAVAIGSTIFKNKGTGASAFGAIWSGVMGPGLLDFSFLSDKGGEIANDGGVTGVSMPKNIGIAYSLISTTSAIVLFDDSGAGPDADYDDLGLRIDVAPIPVPAAGLLLAGALAGLGFAARRRAV